MSRAQDGTHACPTGDLLPACTLPVPPLLHSDDALFVDIDGTLVDFEDRPEAVKVGRPVLDALLDIRRVLGGALVLVTGRTSEDACRMTDQTGFAIEALHGTPREEEVVRLPDRAREALLSGVSVLSRFSPGVWLEDKGAALSIHYRTVPSAHAAVAELAASVASGAPGWRFQEGNCVIELLSEGADKGRVVTRLMPTMPFAGRRPVYLGDDLADEAAFLATRQLGGMPIVVGSRRPTNALFALDSPQSVARWLVACLRKFNDLDSHHE